MPSQLFFFSGRPSAGKVHQPDCFFHLMRAPEGADRRWQSQVFQLLTFGLQ
jgi:hypothetical protein